MRQTKVRTRLLPVAKGVTGYLTASSINQQLVPKSRTAGKPAPSALHAHGYVTRHEGALLKDYAAMAGLEMRAAEARLISARQSGLVRSEGEGVEMRFYTIR